MFKDKILLITGGTGSFGHAVLDAFLDSDIREIRIFSRDEKKQDDMRKKYNNDKIKFYIGDVRDIQSVTNSMYGVDFVFHAAALKQVPSCEFFPLEAVKTNVIGTENIISAAINAGVKKVICLSTDKAVYPVNAMGTSKAMMEKIFVSKSRSVSPDKTLICGTRYGNVMASRGSVIPLFVNQIITGKSLTITDPNMTRYIMSLTEAVELVKYAFINAKSGDIMVQKAPACKIGDLAIALCELFNYPKENITYIGIRHGEKLYESLLSKEESVNAVDLGEYFRIPADQRDLNYDKYFIEGVKYSMDSTEFSSNNTKQLNINEIKEKLLELDYIKKSIQEYKSKTKLNF